MSRPTPRRGDLWWVNFGSPTGRRPGVVLTGDVLLSRLTTATCVAVTTRTRDVDTQVRLTPAHHGVQRDSAANCVNILTVPQDRLIRLISRLDRTTMDEIVTAVHKALDLEW